VISPEAKDKKGKKIMVFSTYSNTTINLLALHLLENWNNATGCPHQKPVYRSNPRQINLIHDYKRSTRKYLHSFSADKDNDFVFR
jgi:hypothetical protein